MKIETTVNANVDVEIDITVDDIRRAIEEDKDSVNGLIRTMNDYGRFLKAVPDSLIAELGEKPRKAFYDFLSEQTKRFARSTDEMCKEAVESVVVNQLIDTLYERHDLVGGNTYPEKMMAIAGYVEGQRQLLQNLGNN